MDAQISRGLLLAYLMMLATGYAAASGGSGGSDNDGENAILPCGQGEVFKECESSSCAELTCASPEPTDECSRDCVFGCFCKDGMYRNTEKKCVSLENCS
ncbi:chymotrypsin-elastase inhibitor ixodidin [Ixodes scapularis]|uniref:von Willebrand factor, putative n=1 Tax=Ixodes scapularis TaxID=6945 RepID=B7P1C0_IXOSC|nr:chymotrypsin-elastase inhibitor ixodidin [Ixodes scapularis]EEC00392.1 von Willebrand factor, putative [Ixodes scapularis]|eukprot:XP_002433328.1 von Willebrand factor, putative [Ixodes scapularis]